MEYWKQELYHHGILGMKWGKRNGPPYPLSRDGNGHTAEERKVGWQKSKLGKRNTGLYDRNEAENARRRYWKKKGYSKPPNKTKSKNGTNLKLVSNKVGGEKKGLTDNQKKALIIGGAALAIGGAAIMGYKLRQLNMESQMYTSGVRSIRNMISTSNETIGDLANSSNVNFGKHWISERDFIQDISRNIDKLPDVSKNPFVSAENKETVKNLRKDVTNLYKNLGNADTARTNSILKEIKNEASDKIKTFEPDKFEYEKFIPETVKVETFKPETFEPEIFKIGEDYTKELLKSNLDILAKMGF